MEFVLLIVFVVVIMVLLEILKNYLLMRGSSYSEISGNNVLDVTFNTGIRGDFYER